jgi:Na+-translocating ferredoxin:NAD+ oxidoreductase RnfC subunit
VCDLFACPLALSPRRFYREFKASLASRNVRFQKRTKPYQADQYRDYRRAPKDKLIRKLGVSKYNVTAEFHGNTWDVDAVEIPLSMNIGAEAVPVVNVGQKVSCGELIGKSPDGKLGANVHSSISGSVTKVNGRIRIEKGGR